MESVKENVIIAVDIVTAIAKNENAAVVRNVSVAADQNLAVAARNRNAVVVSDIAVNLAAIKRYAQLYQRFVLIFDTIIK